MSGSPEPKREQINANSGPTNGAKSEQQNDAKSEQKSDAKMEQKNGAKEGQNNEAKRKEKSDKKNEAKCDGKRVEGGMVGSEGLVLAAKVFLDVELLECRKQLSDLKKAVAAQLFLDQELEGLLKLWNECSVKCGCTLCLTGDSEDEGPNNYDASAFFVDDDDDDNGEDDDHAGWPWPGLSPTEVMAEMRLQKNLNVPENKDQCLLYDRFRDLCRRFGCIEPDDQVDHPSRLRYLPLCTALGNVNVDCRPGCWRARINEMPFPKQVTTLYKMVHSLMREIFTAENDFDPDDCPAAFADWFRANNVSLLP